MSFFLLSLEVCTVSFDEGTPKYIVTSRAQYLPVLNVGFRDVCGIQLCKLDIDEKNNVICH